MFEAELIKQISRLLRPSSETCLSDASDRYSLAEVQRFNPIVRRQIRDLQQYGKSPRMRFLNTGSCRNEETTDMCALVPHGCNPGRKHPSSLKWTGQQVGAKCIHNYRSRQPAVMRELLSFTILKSDCAQCNQQDIINPTMSKTYMRIHPLKCKYCHKNMSPHLCADLPNDESVLLLIKYNGICELI